MTYEMIEKANQAIKTTDIKGKDYAEVNQRIKAFRMCYPNGTIITEIKSIENGVVIMQATVKDEEGKVIATGLAYEKENATFINKTSYIENCETSAVGRALGMCGFGIDVSVASKEEVENAIANQNKKPKQDQENEFEKLITKILNAQTSLAEKGIDVREESFVTRLKNDTGIELQDITKMSIKDINAMKKLIMYYGKVYKEVQ